VTCSTASRFRGSHSRHQLDRVGFFAAADSSGRQVGQSEAPQVLPVSGMRDFEPSADRAALRFGQTRCRYQCGQRHVGKPRENLTAEGLRIGLHRMLCIPGLIEYEGPALRRTSPWLGRPPSARDPGRRAGAQPIGASRPPTCALVRLPTPRVSTGGANAEPGPRYASSRGFAVVPRSHASEIKTYIRFSLPFDRLIERRFAPLSWETRSPSRIVRLAKLVI
jgi:hypothetical protein